MNQFERRTYLIKYLKKEKNTYIDLEIPDTEYEQKRLLRSLMNVRVPSFIGDDFLKIQDEYLQEELVEKGIISLSNLTEYQKELYLWKGDITTLQVDSIVNAANSGMTGCYQPCHSCIDNCIHTYAGIQLRNECNELMIQQGSEEPTGQGKITKAYNLPCKYVIHTVGPIVQSPLNQTHIELLKSCYLSCLKIAEENELESIAFCCISTGVFMFPNDKAAEIAVNTVRQYKEETSSKIKVVFNVFKEEDLEIYEQLLR